MHERGVPRERPVEFVPALVRLKSADLLLKWRRRGAAISERRCQRASVAYDVIVLGLGAMGSAAVHHLGTRGLRVLGIEQFTPPHDKGSSHGGTRMIRQAYWEGPDYIPLILRAYELWEKLERDAGTKLLTITGGLILGAADGQLVRGGIAAAQAYGIPHSVFAPAEIRLRFPAITPLENDVAVYEERAGYLFPEECIRAHLKSRRRIEQTCTSMRR